MKIEIKIGDCSNRIKYIRDYDDDLKIELSKMYNFLQKSDNCIIEDVDVHLLYTLNNGLMAYHVNLEDENIPKFNPEKYKVFENDTCIQREEGFISKNYFNELMRTIMDDYYDCLNEL